MPLGDILRSAAAAGQAAANLGSGTFTSSNTFQMPGGNGGINLSRFQVPTGENSSPPGNYFIRRNNGGGPEEPADQHIGMMLGSLMRGFSELFSAPQFLRMNQMFQGFSPDMFMTNFNSNFQSGNSGEVDFFEMVRRISEQEAEARAKKKRAKTDAVQKLPVVKIEPKHCKKTGNDMEPPSCTVCCDTISLGSKGMFMPCGHIYHPDCLNPWLKDHNTCPVCRFELPTEET